MDVYGSYLHHEPLRPVAQTQQGAAADGCTTIEKANQNKVQSTVDDPHLLAMVQAFHGSLALTEKASPLKPAVLDLQWEKAKSVPSLFTIDKEMAIAGGNFYSTEFLACLAQFDLKSKAGTMAGLDFVTGTAAAEGSHASSSASDCGGVGLKPSKPLIFVDLACDTRVTRFVLGNCLKSHLFSDPFQTSFNGTYL
jgi:hypothetical protein